MSTETEPQAVPPETSPGAAPSAAPPGAAPPLGEQAWDAQAAAVAPAEAELRLDLDGYEGPIDILLSLARDQKVDLAKISILQLADQYLAFVAAARRIRLELAAEYLVMAAWLAYLKSRLLLPDPPADDEPSGEEMAARLTRQLQRLEMIRKVAAMLMGRPLIGRDLFPRGMPEKIPVLKTVLYDITLYQLLRAYADHDKRAKAEPYELKSDKLHTVEEAIERLSHWLGRMPNWTTLSTFLPPGVLTGDFGGVIGRSALASTLVAGLELAKQGKVELRQERAYGPIYVRALAAGGTQGSEG